MVDASSTEFYWVLVAFLRSSKKSDDALVLVSMLSRSFMSIIVSASNTPWGPPSKFPGERLGGKLGGRLLVATQGAVVGLLVGKLFGVWKFVMFPFWLYWLGAKFCGTFCVFWFVKGWFGMGWLFVKFGLYCWLGCICWLGGKF